MKKFILGAFALLMTLGANAESYSRVQASYINDSYNGNKYTNNHDFSTNGIGVSYVYGFGLSKSLPMFVEAGLQFNTSINSETIAEEKYSVDILDKTYNIHEKGKQKFTNINLAIPVNFVWRFNVADMLTVAPYAGINFRVNALGKVKYSVDIDTDLPKDLDKELDDARGSESMNVYSKKDMGNDGTWNRFQMGWQIGVGAEYKNIYLGVQYGTDFIPAFKYEKAKINNGRLAVSVGYSF